MLVMELSARFQRSYGHNQGGNRAMTTIIHTTAILTTLYAAVLLIRFAGI